MKRLVVWIDVEDEKDYKRVKRALKSLEVIYKVVNVAEIRYQDEKK